MMQSSSQILTTTMVTRISKKIIYVLLFCALMIVTYLRLSGWQPTIANIERICSHSIFVCPFHYLTGFDCPGCGITRSLVSFFVGDPVLSFYFHPFGPLIGLGVLYFVVCSFKKEWNLNLDKFASYRFSWSALLVILAWGVLRNI
jgi:hypothetical protein